MKKVVLCTLLLSIFYCFIFSFYTSVLAQEEIDVKEVNVIKLDSKYRIFITSSGPAKYLVHEYYRPRSLVIDIPQASLTFMNKKFMTIPVDQGGIKTIEIREVYTTAKPPQKVEIIIICYEDIDYSVSSQWDGRYIAVDIKSIGPLKAEQKPYPITDKEQAMTRALNEARKRLMEERSKETIEEVRRAKLSEAQAKEDMDAARQKLLKPETPREDIEAARKKLLERARQEEIPGARRELLEGIQARDVHISPLEIRTMTRKGEIRRITSLDDCIEIALQNHRPAQIAKDQVQLARLKIREAKRGFYPKFLGEWRETSGRTITEQYIGRNLGLQLEQPVYTGGKLEATLRKEEMGEKIALGNYDRIKQDLIFKVSQAYYDLIRLQKTYAELIALSEEAKKYLEQTEAEYRIESATVTEFLNVQSAYNQVHYQLISTEKELRLARLSLQREMNVESIDVSGIDYDIRFKKVKLDLDKCLELAYRNRPEPRSIEYMVAQAEYGRLAVDSEKKPNFSLLGTYGKSGESFKSQSLDLGTQWSVMGKVNWFFGGSTLESSLNREESNPSAVTTFTGNRTESMTLDTKFAFWDNLGHFSKLKEAEITKQQAQHQLDQMIQTIRSDVEEAFYNYQKARVQAMAAANEIGYRAKEIEVIKSKKEMNEATYAELLEAMTKFAEAKASYLQAISASHISIVGLNRAMGVTDYFK